MPREFSLGTTQVEPPAETKAILGEQWRKIAWQAQPIDREIPVRVKETDPWQQVETLIEAGYGRELKGAIQEFEATVGCTPQCVVCTKDTPLLLRVMSPAALGKIPDYQEFFTQSKLRSGTFADFLDHPGWQEVIDLLTVSMGRKLRVLTNYRPVKNDQVNQLINLAKASWNLEAIISIPWGYGDMDHGLRKDFKDYFRVRQPGLFIYDEDSITPGSVYTNSVLVYDLNCPDYGLSLSGRMPRTLYDNFPMARAYHEAVEDFRSEGIGKVLVNPDGVWMTVHATTMDSYTGVACAKATPENFSILSQVPIMATDQLVRLGSWPGGVKKLRQLDEGKQLKIEAEESGRKYMQPRIRGIIS